MVQKPMGASRKLIFALVFCLVALVCLLAVSHDWALTRLEVSEGRIAGSSPEVRPYLVMSRPVEDWERDLYDRSRAEGLTPSLLGEELAKTWGVSFGEKDVDAWRERMAVDSSSVEFLGLWFFVPGAGLFRSLYRAYGEYALLLGVSVCVVYYAYVKPLLRRGVDRHSETFE